MLCTQDQAHKTDEREPHPWALPGASCTVPAPEWGGRGRGPGEREKRGWLHPELAEKKPQSVPIIGGDMVLVKVWVCIVLIV